MKKSDRYKTIRDLAKLLDETNLTEIEVQKGFSRIRVARGGKPIASAAAIAPSVSQESQVSSEKVSLDSVNAVKSPMVGTVYLAPEPGSSPFVKEGDTVRKGQTIFIVEAMKTMNPIPAHRAGTVAKVMIKDAQAVEYGEVLAVIE